ncbi:ABC transporter substrate-binding protein [Ottowia sp.]|uniref:ABC transporter substrate-binding protein n=1 Tax=Ottowia sp. TaxID=1898956 RepID=UPI0039E26BA0
MIRMLANHGALALAVALGLAAGATAQTRQLTIIAGGGVLGEGVVKAFVEPFEKESGIKVRVIRDQVSAAKYMLQKQSGNIDFDLAGNTGAGAIPLFREDVLEKIDYGQLDKALMAKLPAEAKKPWGVQYFNYAFVLGLDEAKFPPGKPAPSNWAEFWDVKKFPGTRTLQNAELGIQGPLEEALLADGVPMDKLYPLDVDRAFRSLDRIKPSIRKWWKVGSEQMQLFQSGGVSMGMGFDGRFIALTQAKKPMRIVWNQAKQIGIYWTIPKGSKNVKEAHEFISFAMRPDRQAEMAKITGYAPSNPDAFKHISKELAAMLVTYPENSKNAYQMNQEWYAEVGADGKTNGDRISQRWNEWITK